MKGAHQFEQARLRAQLNRVRSLMRRSSLSLQDLTVEASRCGPPNQHYAGLHSVPVEKIRGSQGRSDDFDGEFNPRHRRSASRWIGVYTAWQAGVALPPVELVQIGDSYYVRDGHHRISVARSLGMRYIDAEVTVVETEVCPVGRDRRRQMADSRPRWNFASQELKTPQTFRGVFVNHVENVKTTSATLLSCIARDRCAPSGRSLSVTGKGHRAGWRAL